MTQKEKVNRLVEVFLYSGAEGIKEERVLAIMLSSVPQDQRIDYLFGIAHGVREGVVYFVVVVNSAVFCTAGIKNTPNKDIEFVRFMLAETTEKQRICIRMALLDRINEFFGYNPSAETRYSIHHTECQGIELVFPYFNRTSNKGTTLYTRKTYPVSLFDKNVNVNKK